MLLGLLALEDPVDTRLGSRPTQVSWCPELLPEPLDTVSPPTRLPRPASQPAAPGGVFISGLLTGQSVLVTPVTHRDSGVPLDSC